MNVTAILARAISSVSDARQEISEYHAQYVTGQPNTADDAAILRLIDHALRDLGDAIAISIHSDTRMTRAN